MNTQPTFYGESIWADLHTHTVACGHGYSTVRELANRASEAGLGALAVTEHGPAIPSGAHPYFFSNMSRLPRSIYGVRLLKGVEANIIDQSGQLDLPDRILKQLDLVMAGFHAHTGYSGKTPEDHTQTLIRCMRRTPVQVISHPANPEYPLDMKAVVSVACEQGVALELNNISLSQRDGCRQADPHLTYDLLAEIRRQRAWYTFGSDAHFDTEVGALDRAVETAESVKLDPDRCVNLSAAHLQHFQQATGIPARLRVVGVGSKPGL